MITVAGKELSEETVKKACEKYGISFKKKPVFETVLLCHLRIGINADYDPSLPIALGWHGVDASTLNCKISIEEAKHHIAVLTSVISFAEAHRDDKN